MLFNHLESLENNRKKGSINSVFEIGPIYKHSKSQENILFALTSNIKNQNKWKDNLDYYYLTKIVSKILGTINFDIRQFNITSLIVIFFTVVNLQSCIWEKNNCPIR